MVSDKDPTIDSTDPNPKTSGKDSTETRSDINSSDHPVFLSDVAQDDLSTSSPEECVEMYLQARKEYLHASTLQAQKSYLSYFVEWSNDIGAENLNDISKSDLIGYCMLQSQSRDLVSIKMNLSTLQVFFEWCEEHGLSD